MHLSTGYPYLYVECQSLGCDYKLVTKNVDHNDPCVYCCSRRSLQKTLIQCPEFGLDADAPLRQNFTRIFYLDQLKRTWDYQCDRVITYPRARTLQELAEDE